MQRKITLSILFGLTLTVSSFAQSAENPTAEKIPTIAKTCLNCHGPWHIENAKDNKIPALKGQNADYLFARLRDFQSPDAKAHFTVMPRLLSDFTETDLQNLADWFSKQKP